MIIKDGQNMVLEVDVKFNQNINTTLRQVGGSSLLPSETLCDFMLLHALKSWLRFHLSSALSVLSGEACPLYFTNAF